MCGEVVVVVVGLEVRFTGRSVEVSLNGERGWLCSLIHLEVECTVSSIQVKFRLLVNSLQELQHRNWSMKSYHDFGYHRIKDSRWKS
jgi:hypothetical protein